MTSTVPFQYLTHLLTVPVRVGDTETRFVFDTGIGVNLVSDSLARAVGWTPSGAVFTGRRMSGHEVTAPMGSLDSVRLGESRRRDVPAAMFDMGAMAGLDGIGGFLSLRYFIVTYDLPRSRMIFASRRLLSSPNPAADSAAWVSGPGRVVKRADERAVPPGEGDQPMRRQQGD